LTPKEQRISKSRQGSKEPAPAPIIYLRSGLPWSLDLNHHTLPTPTEKPVGITVSMKPKNPASFPLIHIFFCFSLYTARLYCTECVVYQNCKFICTNYMM